jgi:hypothetical protein
LLPVDLAGIILSNPRHPAPKSQAPLTAPSDAPRAIFIEPSERIRAPKSPPPIRELDSNHSSEPFQQKLDDFTLRRTLGYLLLAG